MGRYGNFYVGSGGFVYKRNPGGGNHRTFPLGAMGNTPHDVNNRYVPGAGVGASSISNRRARLIKAATCTAPYPCSKEYALLGLYASGGNNSYAFNWYI